MNKRYDSADIIQCAVNVQRTGRSSREDVVTMLRYEFPGITNAAIRKAIKDAQLLLAVKQVMKRESE